MPKLLAQNNSIINIQNRTYKLIREHPFNLKGGGSMFFGGKQFVVSKFDEEKKFCL